MSATARNLITEFVLEKIEAEPLAKRIELLRALAVVEVNKTEAAHLHDLADGLDLAQRQHRQLVLDFKRRTA